MRLLARYPLVFSDTHSPWTDSHQFGHTAAMADGELLKRFGRRVRNLRESLGYSQEAFAERCGLDRTYVGGIERGERNVALRNIASIAEGLGVSISELMNGVSSMNSKQLDDLIRNYSKLTSQQQGLVKEIIEYLRAEIRVEVEPISDLVDEDFANDFANRLLIHHATHIQKFKKKAFEFAFAESKLRQGHTVSIVDDPTHPGADVVIDETKFSLKTEAAKSIKKDKLTISKLMEARWIRDCKTGNDFANMTRERVLSHLDEYERIIVFRAFDVEGPAVEYELIEIPVELLRKMENLTHDCFSKRTKNGSSSAKVSLGGKVAFQLSFDGSVEKVTIRSLLVEYCRKHASWVIPTR